MAVARLTPDGRNSPGHARVAQASPPLGGEAWEARGAVVDRGRGDAACGGAARGRHAALVDEPSGAAAGAAAAATGYPEVLPYHARGAFMAGFLFCFFVRAAVLLDAWHRTAARGHRWHVAEDTAGAAEAATVTGDPRWHARAASHGSTWVDRGCGPQAGFLSQQHRRPDSEVICISSSSNTSTYERMGTGTRANRTPLTRPGPRTHRAQQSLAPVW